MLGKPRIRLNNLKTSLRFPCLGLNPIIDSINDSPANEKTHGLLMLSPCITEYNMRCNKISDNSKQSLKNVTTPHEAAIPVETLLSFACQLDLHQGDTLLNIHRHGQHLTKVFHQSLTL